MNAGNKIEDQNNITLVKDIIYEQSLGGNYKKYHEKIISKYLEIKTELPIKKRKHFNAIEYIINFTSGKRLVCKFFSQKLILMNLLHSDKEKVLYTCEINLIYKKDQILWQLI